MNAKIVVELTTIYATFLIYSVVLARNCWEASDSVYLEVLGYIENGRELRRFLGCIAVWRLYTGFRRFLSTMNYRDMLSSR
jgi:hypothetical protein